MTLFAAIRRRVALAFLMTWPVVAQAQVTSCGTLGWVMAVAEAAQRDPHRNPGAQSRLHRLSHRFAPADVSADLQASLSPSELKTVTDFLSTVRARSEATFYVVDPQLRWSASQASLAVGRVACGVGSTNLRRSSGPATRDGGANSDDGRIYARRESESFLTRKTVERIAVGISVAAAVAALIAAFRFTAVLARRHKRHTCGIDCQLLGTGDRIVTARMIDLSEGGCKIAVGEAAFDTADRLSLRVGGLDLGSIVIWASEAAIGLRFEDSLDAGQVRDLVRQAKAERDAQKRMRREAHLSEA
ncbi:PilZ domain-containing protein [Maribius pontilimi]|uniref:PilZ domain-containing protein n=1 Tax=Palleronia pontilimi TaxID=1964209 RepID=A0A934I7Z1_9RHOB|nr:PilZ domain-containing protein [Palleronia pontilimi]MBJ3761918.1 PilZ domain-containing protein [Palleronia pontilimi]